MAVESPPFATQAGNFGAEQTRRAVFAWAARTASNTPGIVAGGLISSADCQLTAPASGMSVNVGTGEVLIGGTEGGNQGGYYGRATSQTNLAVTAANATNPRVDTVVATSAESRAWSSSSLPVGARTSTASPSIQSHVRNRDRSSR